MAYKVTISNPTDIEIEGSEYTVFVAEEFQQRDPDGGLTRLTPSRLVTRQEYDNLLADGLIDNDTMYLII